MYCIGLQIEGIADLLYNRMTPEELEKFRGGQNAGDMTDEARAKAAEQRVYVDETSLYLPAWTIKKVLLEGSHSAGLKLQRKPLWKRAAATVFVQGVGRLHRDGALVTERDYIHETPGRIPPGPKGRMTIVRRPALRTGWQLSAEIAVLDDGVPPSSLRSALDAAGLYVGVGAWRPEFGRFIVRVFTVTDAMAEK